MNEYIVKQCSMLIFEPERIKMM